MKKRAQNSAPMLARQVRRVVARSHGFAKILPEGLTPRVSAPVFLYHPISWVDQLKVNH